MIACIHLLLYSGHVRLFWFTGGWAFLSGPQGLLATAPAGRYVGRVVFVQAFLLDPPPELLDLIGDDLGELHWRDWWNMLVQLIDGFLRIQSQLLPWITQLQRLWVIDHVAHALQIEKVLAAAPWLLPDSAHGSHSRTIMLPWVKLVQLFLIPIFLLSLFHYLTQTLLLVGGELLWLNRCPPAGCHLSQPQVGRRHHSTK